MCDPRSSDSRRWQAAPCLCLALVSATLTAVPDAAWAQSAGEVDAGQFETVVEGRPATTEVFAIRRMGSETMAVGRVYVERPDRRNLSFEVGLRSATDGFPIRYELRSSSDASRIVALSTGTRIRVSASTEAGERVKEFLAEHLLIVDPAIAHHYHFLIGRIRADGGAGPYRVLEPRDRRVREVLLVSAVPDTITLGDSRMPAIRYDLTFDGQARSVWASAADGLILMASDSARGWIATRVSKE